jgi:hypothetical protein
MVVMVGLMASIAILLIARASANASLSGKRRKSASCYFPIDNRWNRWRGRPWKARFRGPSMVDWGHASPAPAKASRVQTDPNIPNTPNMAAELRNVSRGSPAADRSQNQESQPESHNLRMSPRPDGEALQARRRTLQQQARRLSLLAPRCVSSFMTSGPTMYGRPENSASYCRRTPTRFSRLCNLRRAS